MTRVPQKTIDELALKALKATLKNEAKQGALVTIMEQVGVYDYANPDTDLEKRFGRAYSRACRRLLKQF
jgi:hypothetical protein